ncbi:MAG: dihydrodipicolinate reductase [Acidobacteriota bacterium]|nr:dihydrodipicolinate reductase [Acidobacteriota bacterium]
MGQLVEGLAPQYGFELAGWLDETNNPQASGLTAGRWTGVDVAIDFSTADAVVANLPALARLGIPAVIGTTGWQAHQAELRRVAQEAGIGVVAAPNFSTGVVLFEALAEYAGRLLGAQEEFGAWVHELHHVKKVDAPSGTALMLKAAVERGGWARPIDMSSTRAGYIPGTHTIGFDAPSETLTLTHTARDRATFARGALHAARWLPGRRGWFTMRDVLGLTAP